MGLLDNQARRRAERQLSGVLEAGEKVAAVEAAMCHPWGPVHLAATDRRLFVVQRGGNTIPIRLSLMGAVEVRGRTVVLSARDPDPSRQDIVLTFEPAPPDAFVKALMSAVG